MDLQLNLVKSDNDVWGFRLKGGAEYDLPFLVVHVAENSVAERAGLWCNDAIVSVNDTPTEGLVHNETHALLLAAGNNLVLGITRGMTNFVSPATCEDESCEEIYNIMQPYIGDEEEFEHQRQVDFEIINPSEEKFNLEEKSPPEEKLEAVPQPMAELTAAPLRENAISGKKDTKWSAFLQKPKNPIPVLKKEEEGPKAEPYRVIITKQKKRSPEELKHKKFQEMRKEEEVSELAQIEESVEEDGQGSLVSQEELSRREETEEVEGETEEKAEDEIHEDVEEERSSPEDKNGEEAVEKEEEEAQKEDDAELQKFLGEKLAEVQKQLEALSKLPSTMQLTIDALNKQLASIVGVANPVNEIEEKESSRGNSESGDDAAEQNITEDENEEDNIEVDAESGQGEEQTESTREELEENEETEEVEPELTEEQKEALRMEQELLEKQQKEQELLEEFQQRRLKQKPTLPLRPIQRPIILPGGRRWSQPDDAIPLVAKNKKMSDEKIANTLDTYAEVITGRTKGINFQKYTPPAKNLDYLQRSDVYKLIHDMEPPLRGICSRASKILAEQDYYPTG